MSGYTLFNSNKSLASNCLALVIPFVLLDTIPLSGCLYDGFGRLEQVTKADGSFQKNHYDAEGLRAEMEENGQLVKFLYNENREAVAEEEKICIVSAFL